MPKVLIADKLSPAAVAIFQERGVEADVKTGLPKDEFLHRLETAIESASNRLLVEARGPEQASVPPLMLR